jgi:murein L,D-transpeptidase YcbB/YkuD
MRYVEFNPYWNVPPTIQRKEIAPRLARDPGYLAREEMEFVDVRGRGAPVTAVNAETLAALAAGKLRVRQRPGARNALDGIKFVLPNTMDIYLHGTPAHALFARDRRDFSHGCIRLSDPAALAAFVLRDQPAWTPARIAEAMASGRQSAVPLTSPLPVVIFYSTAIVDRAGQAVFLDDVYGEDRKLDAALAQWSARARPAFPAMAH